MSTAATTDFRSRRGQLWLDGCAARLIGRGSLSNRPGNGRLRDGSTTITCEAARRGIRAHIVIDFVHVLEKLWAAAWSLHPPAATAAED